MKEKQVQVQEQVQVKIKINKAKMARFKKFQMGVQFYKEISKFGYIKDSWK